MNFTIKNEENIHSKKYRIIRMTFSLLILIATISNDGKNMISIFAQFEEEEKDSSVKKSASEDKNNNNNNNNNNDLTTITVQIDKNNTKNNDNLLKIVGYLNGEGQTKYVDLKEIDKEMNLNDKFLKVDLKFNKSNDISSTMVDDEYYVCA